MIADELKKHLAAQVGCSKEKAPDWLKPFRKKAETFTNTPYQKLAKVLIDSQDLQDHDEAFSLYFGQIAKDDPFEEHPEILDALTDPENPFLIAFWPPEWVPVVAKSLEYAFCGIYQPFWDRRTFRTREKCFYHILPTLCQLFRTNRIHQTPETFALEWMKEQMTPAVLLAPFLAVMLDSESPAVTKAFQVAIYENSGTLSREIILSLFFSRAESNWEMAADLLVAAQLQEGLRQAVLESCSDGRMEAFRYMMHVVSDHDLLRFPAAVRAFDTWLGLAFETVRLDTVRRLFASALAALEDPEHFKVENPRDLFIRLWAIANTEVLEAGKKVVELLEDDSSSSPELCTALTFYEMTGLLLPDETALKLLRRCRDNRALSACVLKCYTGVATRALSSDTAEQLYFEYRKLLPLFPKKAETIPHPAFEWLQLQLSAGLLWYTILLPLSQKAWTKTVLEDMAQAMPDMPNDFRDYFVEHILDYLAPTPPQKRHGYNVFWNEESRAEDTWFRSRMFHTPILRQALFAALTDKSVNVRESALNTLSRMKLSMEELVQVEDTLVLKTASIRRAALEILMKSDHPELSAARLRASGNALKIAAAEELSPVSEPASVIDKAHGYGLYDVGEAWTPLSPHPDPEMHPAAILKDDSEVIMRFLADFSDLLEAHLKDECPRPKSGLLDVGTEILTLDQVIQENYSDAWWTDIRTENPPLPELWDTFFRNFPLDTRDLVHAFLLLLNPEAKEVRAKFLQMPDKKGKWCYPYFIRSMIHRTLIGRDDFPAFSAKLLIATACLTPPDFWKIKVKESIWGFSVHEVFVGETNDIRSICTLFDDAEFSPEMFSALCRLDECHVNMLSPQKILKAFGLGFITRNTMRRLLISGQESEESDLGFQAFSRLDHPEIHLLFTDSLELELTRGELPTALSKPLCACTKLEGAKYFIRILDALGERPFIRGYSWRDAGDRQNVFSHLLKVCRPQNGDAEEFRNMLKARPIKPKRLLEAAMYSPAWLEIVGEYLNIPELPLAGWYFHAHVNENFSAEKETAVARYSSISPQEFNDGAFDIDWFHEAYNAVGPEMFARLYDAAKYISGGANHRRSQIFADAALGKLSEAEVEEKIKTKRNKEYVMAYGILPGKANDFPRRYENLMKFKKESRQFGGQRQASEKLAVEIAVANLARTAGFNDVNRFLWRMEAAKLDEWNALFAPHEVDGVTLSLAIDSDGRAEIRAKKAEKELKSIPASLKKDAYVLELQSAVKSLRDQHSRARKSLEEAMIREDVFEYAEVRELMSNPVLGPLASKLLWQAGDTIDFFEKLPETPLKIAHPTGLFRSGRWAEFQRLAVERKLVQPFKQIFRELYTLNADEKLDGMKSARYSGNQVMPKKAVALLRTRGWTVDMDEGLQKVFHRQNLIAKIYAMADWFSPAEVEPPTLEYVLFEHRRTREIIPLEKIVPVLFSEVMRDLDLMVSVAHAGGVDPEASHSTVEMRAALIRTMLPFFKLDNVRIEKSHAFITGKFGEYTVHLGSGVCHKQASGMLNILPVHSQTRGRIFLPFADDDPKTAEVLTKILFLAEDDKIKDPSILEQIIGGVI